MEQIIALFLGYAASRLQGNWFKNLKIQEATRIRLRYSISLLLSIIAGVISTLPSIIQNGEVNRETVLMNVGVAFTVSQTYYNTYFRLK